MYVTFIYIKVITVYVTLIYILCTYYLKMATDRGRNM
jgi:hypothetical protein